MPEGQTWFFADSVGGGKNLFVCVRLCGSACPVALSDGTGVAIKNRSSGRETFAQPPGENTLKQCFFIEVPSVPSKISL